VESSIRLGVADAIADVVETGTTLRKAGLELFGDPILLSEAILVQRPQNRGDIDPLALAHLQQRLSGVIVARDYVLMDYDIPVEQVEEASALTPGLESPTISPLAKEGWVAVRVNGPGQRPPVADGSSARPGRSRHSGERIVRLPFVTELGPTM
jgi:ATP phosphoribosyltransferase